MTTGFIRIVNKIGYRRNFLSPNLVHVETPGLPYVAYDAYENPFPWTVMALMDSAATCTMFRGTDDANSLLDIANHYDYKTAFTVTLRIEFNQKLYDEATDKTRLHVETGVDHVGKTSLVTKVDLKAGTHLLSRYFQQSLCVDDDTKRPINNPDWLHDNFKKHGVQGNAIRFPVLEKPQVVKRVVIGRVKYSDTDCNFHLNFANYLKYCVDGIHEGLNAESKSGNQIRRLLLKSAFLWYRQECLIGDMLHIEYWQSDEVNKYYVDLLKEDTSMFQCILKFYNDSELKSSL